MFPVSKSLDCKVSRVDSSDEVFFAMKLSI
jgi:hypothetical protein